MPYISDLVTQASRIRQNINIQCKIRPATSVRPFIELESVSSIHLVSRDDLESRNKLQI